MTVAHLTILLAAVTATRDKMWVPASAVLPLDPSTVPPTQEDILRVAVVQMTNFNDGILRSAAQEISDKTDKVVDYIQQAAGLGADIAVFPEMVLVRYDAKLIANGTGVDVSQAESRISSACASAGIWALVGLPKYLRPDDNVTQASCNTMTDTKWWNTALVFNGRGEKVYRQAKLRCGGPDGQLGQWLDVFQGPKNVTSSLQICADAGDPNIARLPVFKGSRVIFDISAESGLDIWSKMAPYEAQYMARAHESHSFVVQANMGSTWDSHGRVLDAQGGSHGNSLVAAPDGNILVRAGAYGEQLVLQDLDLRLAPPQPGYQPHSFMEPFYKAGMSLMSPMPID